MFLQDVSNIPAGLMHCLIEQQSGKWFKVDKCKVMHLGTKNMHASYILRGVQLEESMVEKDLGIPVDYRPNNSAMPSCHF